jgi:LmbE family N-acetylglucosaminyl deacetylase
VADRRDARVRGRIDFNRLDIAAGSRVLLLAPHPDDEALAMGGLLQRAIAARASIRVVFFTDGENNPWPQRAVDRRWRIGPRERARWGARRRTEALRSLRTLGLGAEHASFLGLPDQRLTSMLVDGDPTLRRALRELLDEHTPTHVIAPSVQDHHPDHSALAVAVRSACERGRRNARVRLLEYVVHDGRQRPVGSVSRILLTPDEIERKRGAIACHVSQLVFRRKELLAFARRHERYYSGSPLGAEEPSHPIRSVTIEGDRLAIRLVRRPCVRAFGPVIVHLLFPQSYGIRRVLRVPLPPRTGAAELLFADGRAYPHAAEYRGGPYRGMLRVPLTPLPRMLTGYVKLESRFGFFDEAGWRTLPVLKVRGGRRAPAAAAREALTETRG